MLYTTQKYISQNSIKVHISLLFSDLRLLRKEIYFNNRNACPYTAPTLEPDGKTCNSKYCCRHTQLQAAEWNFRVRGKCWVLRSPLRSSKYHNGDRRNFRGNGDVSLT